MTELGPEPRSLAPTLRTFRPQRHPCSGPSDVCGIAQFAKLSFARGENRCRGISALDSHLLTGIITKWGTRLVILIPEAPMKIQELKVGLRVRKGSMWRLETHVFSKWSNWGTVPHSVWKCYHLDPAVQLRECTWGTLLGAFHASITFFLKTKP